MNERIKELAREAGLLTHNPDGPPTKLEKFAELIVRECLVQVNEVYTTLDNSDERVGVARVGLTIAAHFGVEE
jgi:hypothetical protein